MRSSGVQIDAALCGHFAALRLVRAALATAVGGSASPRQIPPAFAVCAATLRKRGKSAALTSAHSRLDKDADGSVRLMWAYGRWEDAETLHYIPINETMEIEAKEEF